MRDSPQGGWMSAQRGCTLSPGERGTKGGNSGHRGVPRPWRERRRFLRDDELRASLAGGGCDRARRPAGDGGNDPDGDRPGWQHDAGGRFPVSRRSLRPISRSTRSSMAEGHRSLNLPSKPRRADTLVITHPDGIQWPEWAAHQSSTFSRACVTTSNSGLFSEFEPSVAFV